MGLKFSVVDTFTDKPFAGNPAAVLILPGIPQQGDGWMKAVSSEMNLPATCFTYPFSYGFGLRWYGPSGEELDACGHGGLASAHALWEEGRVAKEDAGIRFYTRVGLLRVERNGGWIEISLPPMRERACPAAAVLSQALGVGLSYVGGNGLDYLVEVESEEALRTLDPDFELLKTLPVRGVIVTSAPGRSSGYDYISRYFAPSLGINEDQATGSSYCSLGPYWGGKLGKNSLLAYQASPRGGTFRVRIGADRIYLEGQAVTTLRWELV